MQTLKFLHSDIWQQWVVYELYLHLSLLTELQTCFMQSPDVQLVKPDVPLVKEEKMETNMPQLEEMEPLLDDGECRQILSHLILGHMCSLRRTEEFETNSYRKPTLWSICKAPACDQLVTFSNQFLNHCFQTRCSCVTWKNVPRCFCCFLLSCQHESTETAGWNQTCMCHVLPLESADLMWSLVDATMQSGISCLLWPTPETLTQVIR